MDTMAHLTHSDGLCIQLTRRDYSAWTTRRVEDSRRGGAGAGGRADVADPRPGSGRPGPGPASAVAQLRGFRHIASVFTSKTGSMKCHPYWIIVRTEMRWHL